MPEISDLEHRGSIKDISEPCFPSEKSWLAKDLRLFDRMAEVGRAFVDPEVFKTSIVLFGLLARSFLQMSKQSM